MTVTQKMSSTLPEPSKRLSIRRILCVLAVGVAAFVVRQLLISSQSSYEIHKSIASSLSSFDAPSIRTIIDEAKHQLVDSNTVGTSSSFEPLNVIIFYPDDMRYDSLEDVRGPNVVKTPFLSELAKNGIRFTHNAVTTSICWVSRATLFTGRYGSQHGSDRLYCPRFTLHEHWKNTWPRLLQKAGYFVGHIGKWQYHNSPKFRKTLFDWSDMFEGQHWHGSKNNGYIHASDMAFESARKFLNDKRPKDKPFALTVALYPPKAVGVSSVPGAQFRPKNSTRALYDNITYQRPYDVDKAFASLPDFLRRPRGIWRGRYVERWNSSEQFQESMRNYHALITENDIACAGITSIIKNQGLWNKTMIIFTSDNGLLTGAHGLAGKWNPFEESIRVPLIIYDPRMPMEKRGTTDDSFTLNIDLAETILGAAKISPPKIMQGRDIADLYLRPNTTTPWRDEFYYEFPEGIGLTPSEALVRKKYKYIKYPNAGVEFEQFFDLENDPYELNDLLHSSDLNASSSVKGVLEEMRQRFIILRDQLTEPNKTIPPDSCLDIEGWKKNKTYPVVG